MTYFYGTAYFLWSIFFRNLVALYLQRIGINFLRHVNILQYRCNARQEEEEKKKKIEYHNTHFNNLPNTFQHKLLL